MKTNSFIHFSLLCIMVFANYSCGASKAASEIETIETVKLLELYADSIYKDNEAVVLAESIKQEMRITEMSPFKHKSNIVYTFPSHLPTRYWQTEVRCRIKLYASSIDHKSFSEIIYTSPSDSRTNLMRDFKGWIYSTNSLGVVSRRSLNKDETLNEQLNDSLRIVKFQIKEDLQGKVLEYQYTVLMPYDISFAPNKTVSATGSSFPETAQLPIRTFQRDIPVIQAKYEVSLPSFKNRVPKLINEVKQIGKGEMEIQKTTGSSSASTAWKGDRFTLDFTYDKYVVSAKNIPPYLDKSAPPLGVQIIRTEDW